MIICFDVDGTLEISGGPIPLSRLNELKGQGIDVYIVNQGYWRREDLLRFVPANVSSSLSRVEILKELAQLSGFRIYVGDAESDRDFASQVGYNFIYAKDFK